MRMLAMGRWGLRAVAKKSSIRTARWSSSSSQATNRQLLSALWIPTGGQKAVPKNESAHDRLLRAGFLRQSQSGIFHLLPLGHIVQSKIVYLLDKHMSSLGASRLSMSTLTTEELWQRSGRYDSISSELFKLKDRKDVSMMLAPTHEEEVTTLVADTVKSYKELPVRLYQTTRKYRDEIRPRHGLLRGREFVMMDLYSFDLNYEKAFESYNKVKSSYENFFSELGLKITMAEASSGDMGGDLSHEWHAAIPNGSDTIFVCLKGSAPGCGYAANDEVATTRRRPSASLEGWSTADAIEWRGITKDKTTLVRTWLYKSRKDIGAEDVNIHAVKALVPDLDTSISSLAWRTEDDSTSQATHLVDILDSRLSAHYKARMLPESIYSSSLGGKELQSSVIDLSKDEKAPDLARITQGDGCPRCNDGVLHSKRSMEMGHTFYLGTRYTEPLNARVSSPDNKMVQLHMGCYGIGVSRIIGTIAEYQAQRHGVNWSWPIAIAPFQIVVIPVGEVTEDVMEFYDRIQHGKRRRPDIVLDDRQRSFGWKMKDAESFGIPIIVVLGKSWKDKGEVEWRCQGTGAQRNVQVDQVADLVDDTLDNLEKPESA